MAKKVVAAAAAFVIGLAAANLFAMVLLEIYSRSNTAGTVTMAACAWLTFLVYRRRWSAALRAVVAFFWIVSVPAIEAFDLIRNWTAEEGT